MFFFYVNGDCFDMESVFSVFNMSSLQGYHVCHENTGFKLTGLSFYNFLNLFPV